MDEAYKHILQFANSTETNPQVIAKQGRTIVTMIVDRLGSLRNDEGLSEFCLGGVIKKLRQDDAWKLFDGSEPHWVFGDFCRNILGMSQQKTMGLLRVWERSQNVGMTPEEIQEVGWAVADEILRHAKSSSDIVNLMGRYRASDTASEFLQSLKTTPISTGAPVVVKRKRRAFKLDESEDQFTQETLERAALRMKGELNRDIPPEKAMLFIMTEWRQSLNENQAE